MADNSGLFGGGMGGMGGILPMLMNGQGMGFLQMDGSLYSSGLL